MTVRQIILVVLAVIVIVLIAKLALAGGYEYPPQQQTAYTLPDMAQRNPTLREYDTGPSEYTKWLWGTVIVPIVIAWLSTRALTRRKNGNAD